MILRHSLKKKMGLCHAVSGCVKMRYFTVSAVAYHVISPMFVNMRHPHVIVAMRKDSPSAWPTSDRGSVRGGVPVLRYGKSLAGYFVMNVRSGIDIGDNKSETGTRWTVHSPRSGSELRRPGNESESCGPGKETVLG